MSQIRLTDVAGVSTPTAGVHAIYTKTDGLYVKNDAGTETLLGAGGAETKILAQNVLLGVTATPVGGGALGALYLPSGTISAASSIFMGINDSGIVATTVTVTLFRMTGMVPVASFVLLNVAALPGETIAAVPVSSLSNPIVEDWYVMTATFTGGITGATVHLYGCRLIINP